MYGYAHAHTHTHTHTHKYIYGHRFNITLTKFHHNFRYYFITENSLEYDSVNEPLL